MMLLALLHLQASQERSRKRLKREVYRSEVHAYNHACSVQYSNDDFYFLPYIERVQISFR